jgi:Cellulose binding domain
MKTNKMQIIAMNIAVLTLIILTSFNVSYGKNTDELFDKFQYGITIDSDIIPKSAPLVAGPWFITSNSTGPVEFLSKFNESQNETKVPYIYTYLLAGNAREAGNLGDCNIGLPSEMTLCHGGAKFLRRNKDKILQEYISTSYKIKNSFGSNKPILIHVEPDFYQYNDSTQSGGGLSLEELQNIMNSWTDAIKGILPNAYLVMDVSPWHHDLGGFSRGLRNFSYAGLVGKRFDPSGDNNCGMAASIDCKPYSSLSLLTGKKLIISDAYGEGGRWLNYNYNWHNRDVVNSRWLDNVVGVLQSPTNMNSYDWAIKQFQYNPINSPQHSISNKIQQNTQSKKIINTDHYPVCNTSNIVFSVHRTNYWDNGMVAILKVKNNSKLPIYKWDAKLNLNQKQSLDSSWNASLQVKNKQLNIAPGAQWNTIVYPDQEVEVGMIVNYRDYNSILPQFEDCNIYFEK